MKKLRGSLAAKLAAILLFSVLAVTGLFSLLGTFYLSDSGAYTLGYENAAARAVEGLAENTATMSATPLSGASFAPNTPTPTTAIRC